MVNFNATQNILRQYANSYRLKDIFPLSISNFKKALYSPNKVQISLFFSHSNRNKQDIMMIESMGNSLRTQELNIDCSTY